MNNFQTTQLQMQHLQNGQNTPRPQLQQRNFPSPFQQMTPSAFLPSGINPQQHQHIQQLLALQKQGKATPQQTQQLTQYAHYIQKQQQMKLIAQRQTQPNTGPIMPRVNLNSRPIAQLHPQQRPLLQRNGPRIGLLPPTNTYAPRLRRGATAMVTPVAVEVKSANRRRFEEYVEKDGSDASSDEIPYSEETDSDLGSEEREEKRQKKEDLANQRKANQEALKAEKEKIDSGYIPPFQRHRRIRALPQTVHEMEKIYLPTIDNSDVLVPITIEIDLEDFKIVDSFTWNLNERAITPEKFSEYFCADLGLDPNHYANMVSRSVHQQVDAFRKYYQYSDAPVAEDTRTIIRLDIILGKVQLRDRFEWDLASDLKPEIFAAHLVNDLHLGGEFVTLIAHSIHEQLHKMKTTKEYEGSTFAIEKPYRSEEEAKAWSPFVDCGEVGEEEEEDKEEDRSTRHALFLIKIGKKAAKVTRRKKIDNISGIFCRGQLPVDCPCYICPKSY